MSFFFPPLGAVLPAALIGHVKGLFVNPIITSCKFRQAIMRVTILSNNEWVHFGNLRLFNRMSVNPVIVFSQSGVFCDANWSVFFDLSWFPNE